MSSERLQRQIERLLNAAEQAVADRDWPQLRDHCRHVLTLDPDNADAQAFLAVAERGLAAPASAPAAAPRPVVSAANPFPLPAPHLDERLRADDRPSDGERRHLTVMFCDLADSTALSQRLDPEELREVLRAFQQVCAGTVAQYGGHVAHYMGDGLLVYFGYPEAHEDDARRSVRAGLAIVNAVGGLNTRLEAEIGVRLSVRAGIHTGLVVLGEMGSGARVEPADVVGETPNIAARLQAIAGANMVVISAATHRLVQGFFDCEALGAQLLTGVTRPLAV